MGETSESGAQIPRPVRRTVTALAFFTIAVMFTIVREQLLVDLHVGAQNSPLPPPIRKLKRLQLSSKIFTRNFGKEPLLLALTGF